MGRGPTAALLLTGGYSRRMGCDKAWLSLDGEPLLRRLARAATSACDLVVILARDDQELPPLDCDFTRLDDPPSERGAGPLAAVTRGLEEAARRGAALACLGACDMPFLDALHFSFVLAHLERMNAQAVVPIEGATWHTMAGALRVDPALELSARLVGEGDRALVSLYRGLNALALAPSELPRPEALLGCNTPQEWQAIHDA